MLDLIAPTVSAKSVQVNHSSVDLNTTWQKTLNQLSTNHRPVFRQAQLVQCTSNSATVRFRAAAFLNLAMNYQAAIEQALSQVLGYQISVQLCA